MWGWQARLSSTHSGALAAAAAQVSHRSICSIRRAHETDRQPESQQGPRANDERHSIASVSPVCCEGADGVRRKRHGGEHKVIRVSPLLVVPDLPQPGRTLVMGVVNVTPDSFSDGGDWFDPAVAITHGMDLLSEGADIIDVGGESTRPGAVRPEVSEELRRVLPVVRDLAAAGACVSIDTMRAAVAEPAIAAGARLVNDVSGGRSDPGMLRLVADAGVCYVCMHWRGHSEDMQN